MYRVEKQQTTQGRETIIVSSQGRRIGSASLRFVQWMHEFAPRKQLRPEQLAMVDWYGDQQI